jgi:peptidoglycan-associated lipoprotein
MIMNKTTRVLLLSMMSVAVLAGCKTKSTKPEAPTDTTTAPTTPTTPVTSGAYGPGDLDTDACLRQRVVYFDLDQDALKPEFQAIMGCHAKYLRDRPSSRITLEGHADERGSREYNLGLGERRGNAVNSALQANGGSASQLTVVSYGEERPVCTDSSESCWSQNRRVEIVYTAK